MTTVVPDGLTGLPPDGPCPDCHAPAGRWCYPECPRFYEDPGTGDDPDGN